MGRPAGHANQQLNELALLVHFEESGDEIALQKGYPGMMSVVSNVLADGMGFWGFIFKPGVFDHIPPPTFEGGWNYGVFYGRPNPIW